MNVRPTILLRIRLLAQKIANESEFWGTAGAGILFIATNTGRILLTLRSKQVYEPRTWGLPGGKIEEGETPEQAAIEEAKEELKYHDDVNLIPSYVYKDTKTGFRYHNFLGLVPNEFEPVLDWENDDARWFKLSRLPKKLHYGFQALIQHNRSQIEKHTRVVI